MVKINDNINYKNNSMGCFVHEKIRHPMKTSLNASFRPKINIRPGLIFQDVCPTSQSQA